LTLPALTALESIPTLRAILRPSATLSSIELPVLEDPDFSFRISSKEQEDKKSDETITVRPINLLFKIEPQMYKNIDF
jgi:hypothetical protein